MFSHLCRACLTQFNHLSDIVPLFEPHENISYYRICNELQLLVQHDDQLGCNVCKNCSQKIMKFYNFVLTYRESDRKLREMLKNATVAVDEIIECKPNIADFGQPVEDNVQTIKIEMEDCDVGDTKKIPSQTPNPDPIATVKWKCSTCQSEFKTRYQLRRHRKSHQLKQSETKVVTPLLQCTICQNEFSYRRALEEHKREHYEYECDICTKRFNSKQKIRHHLITHLNECRRKFLCVTCGSQFCAKSGLLQHIRAVHDKERNFHCTECGRRFAYHQHLKIHMNRHNGYRPYACNVCEKTFYDSTTLNAHKKFVHSGANTFVCHICSKAFNRNGNLKQHMIRVHHMQLAIQKYKTATKTDTEIKKN